MNEDRRRIDLGGRSDSMFFWLAESITKSEDVANRIAKAIACLKQLVCPICAGRMYLLPCTGGQQVLSCHEHPQHRFYYNIPNARVQLLHVDEHVEIYPGTITKRPYANANIVGKRMTDLREIVQMTQEEIKAALGYTWEFSEGPPEPARAPGK